MRADGIREFEDKMLAFETSVSRSGIVSSGKDRGNSNQKSRNVISNFMRNVQRGMMSAE
jgi:hypothetical protein